MNTGNVADKSSFAQKQLMTYYELNIRKNVSVILISDLINEIILLTDGWAKALLLKFDFFYVYRLYWKRSLSVSHLKREQTSQICINFYT